MSDIERHVSISKMLLSIELEAIINPVLFRFRTEMNKANHASYRQILDSCRMEAVNKIVMLIESNIIKGE